MKKYWCVFSLYWQENLQKRSSFFVDRFRALVVLVSFYYLWSTLLKGRSTFAGYDHSQIITYVLGMNILQSLVFAGNSWEMAGEINHGRLSIYLTKPLNYFVYTVFRELSEKAINLLSAMIEISALFWVFHVDVRWPHSAFSWVAFALATVGATGLYFLLAFMVGCAGFWTAESGGPRFLIELFLEFTAGAFFPLDVLPAALQHALKVLPSPYMVFFPLQVFLEKLTASEIMQGFAIQFVWLGIFGGLTAWVWHRGVAFYGAEGS